MTEEKTLEPKPGRFSLVQLIGAGVVGFFVGLSQVTDAVDKVLVFFHKRPDVFSVAEDNAKSAFSKHLIELSWTRHNSDRNYLSSVMLTLDGTNQEAAWKIHADAVSAWNVELMNLILGVQQYYGSEKRGFLENNVQPGFGRVASCLSKIRYASNYERLGNPHCQSMIPDVRNEKSNNEIAENLIDDQNRALYCLASDLTDKGQPCR